MPLGLLRSIASKWDEVDLVDVLTSLEIEGQLSVYAVSRRRRNAPIPLDDASEDTVMPLYGVAIRNAKPAEKSRRLSNLGETPTRRDACPFSSDSAANPELPVSKSARPRFLLVVSVAMLLSGCYSTMGTLKTGLSSLVGQSTEYAFSVLGYPNSQQEFGDKTIYRYGNSTQSTMMLPTSQAVSGQVGGTPVSGTITGTQAVPISGECEIILVANASGIVTSYEYDGNMFGCDRYAQRIRAQQ